MVIRRPILFVWNSLHERTHRHELHRYYMALLFARSHGLPGNARPPYFPYARGSSTNFIRLLDVVLTFPAGSDDTIVGESNCATVHRFSNDCSKLHSPGLPIIGFNFQCGHFVSLCGNIRSWSGHTTEHLNLLDLRCHWR